MKDLYAVCINHDGLASVDLMPGSDNLQPMMMVTRVMVTKKYRGKGYGTQIMRQVLDDADAERMNLMLEPVPEEFDGEMSFEALVAWYERLGFVMLPEFNAMYRVPS